MRRSGVSMIPMPRGQKRVKPGCKPPRNQFQLQIAPGCKPPLAVYNLLLAASRSWLRAVPATAGALFLILPLPLFLRQGKLALLLLRLLLPPPHALLGSHFPVVVVARGRWIGA